MLRDDAQLRRASNGYILASGLLAILIATLAGCGPRATASMGDAGREAALSPSARTPDSDFRPPPTLEQADPAGSDAVTLTGRAVAGSTVILMAPDGERHEARADGDGRWRITLSQASPRLFAFSSSQGARVLRGEGAVAVLPAGRALLLRSGAPSWPTLGPAVSSAPRLIAFDFDAGGGAGASGWAAPGQLVQLAVDGEAFGAGQADAHGRFALLAVRAALKLGRHRVTATTPGGATSAEVDLTPPEPLGPAPFRAVRAAGGWRIDWSPPGGGVQSTLVFAAAGKGRPA